MLKVAQILVRTLVLAGGVAALAACGQKGVLFIPTESAAAQRATLPQTLRLRPAATPGTTPVLAPGATAPAATPRVPAEAPATEADQVPETIDLR